MEMYNYLVKRKVDGKLFYLHGNFKNPAYGVSYLFDIVDDDEKSEAMVNAGLAFRCDFGRYGSFARRNVSNDTKYNSREYSVIYQILN